MQKLKWLLVFVCVCFSHLFMFLMLWIFPGDAGGDGGEAAPSEGDAAE